MNYTGATILPHPHAGSEHSPGGGSPASRSVHPDEPKEAMDGPPPPSPVQCQPATSSSSKRREGEDAPSPVPSANSEGGTPASPFSGSPRLHGIGGTGAYRGDSSTAADHRTEEILLPHQEEHVTYLAVDIGGSLAKVVWFVPHASPDATSATPSLPSPVGGRLLFHRFETARIQACYDFVRALLPPSSSTMSTPGPTWILKLTGGGAYKYYDLFATLPVRIEREDEMTCLISGLNFFTRQVEYEVFTYDERSEGDPVTFEAVGGRLFPYLVVNIGSGVSILKVTDVDCYERISGTSLGGGTLWGLLSLLTNADSYEDMLRLSQEGDNRNVDMLVGDIYGGDYPKIGLKATTIASSFGKVFKAPREERIKFQPQDISRSLLYLVSNNIGQIAYLNAKLHGVERIYFSGFFICGHPVTMNTLSYAVSFWSKGTIKALFLRHEGYLGAMGAFLKQAHHAPPDVPAADELGTVSLALDREDPVYALRPRSLNVSASSSPSRILALSYMENFSVADGSPITAVGALEGFPEVLEPFALLPLVGGPRGVPYHPDTLALRGTEDQGYWIDLLDGHLDELVGVALSHVPAAEGEGDLVHPVVGPAERIAQFASLYRQHLQRLRQEPHAYGVLTVRSLLNLREQCLIEVGFTDIFRDVKERENDLALAAYPALVREVFGMASLDPGWSSDIPQPDFGRAEGRLASQQHQQQRLLDTLLDNALAGNMYDWGSATVVAELKANSLNFQAAKDRVLHSPGTDQRDALVQELVERWCCRRPYRKVVVFVDNSGADIVLGILPLARYLLLCGSQVLLAANSRPAVNDVTYAELSHLLQRAGRVDPVMERALALGHLRAVATGSGSPCLDLTRVARGLNLQCANADLVVLEGMGRAIHTNYHARLGVDVVKVGVFKNPRLAAELGARLYDGLVRFDRAPPSASPS